MPISAAAPPLRAPHAERAQRGQPLVRVQGTGIGVRVGLATDPQPLARARRRGVKEEGAEHVAVQVGVAGALRSVARRRPRAPRRTGGASAPRRAASSRSETSS